MSKVMQALENSERLHQAIEPSANYGLQASQAGIKPTSKWICALAVVAPSLIVAGGMAYQTYHDYQQQWLADNVSQTIIVDVPFALEVQTAPAFNALRDTYKVPSEPSELSTMDLAQEESVIDSKVSPSAQKPNKDEDLLKGIDLSGLSPELAQRFESAISSQPNKTKTVSRDASNLAQDAEQWYGKLPPLNFQTHVYSSQESKRWVKINGTEYGQGDWINDELQLIAIEQQSCLVRYQGELIEIPALYDWQG